jgi:hypothetical protein
MLSAILFVSKSFDDNELTLLWTVAALLAIWVSKGDEATDLESIVYGSDSASFEADTDLAASNPALLRFDLVYKRYTEKNRENKDKIDDKNTGHKNKDSSNQNREVAMSPACSKLFKTPISPEVNSALFTSFAPKSCGIKHSRPIESGLANNNKRKTYDET